MVERSDTTDGLCRAQPPPNGKNPFQVISAHNLSPIMKSNPKGSHKIRRWLSVATPPTAYAALNHRLKS
ncbi:MAG: hypothetical protein KIH69_011655 [Anaerolineae bacterium]|nr:hypothetical protein [Anaerolineae bacterium]